MAVPSPKTWTASEFVDATEANVEWRDTFNFILAPPRLGVFKSANQSINSGTDTLVTWDSEIYDPYATPMHDNATNNSRLVGVETGIYLVSLKVVWAANATGVRNWQLRKNAAGSAVGGTLIDIVTADATSASIGLRMLVALDIPLTANDYLEVFVQQTSGAALNMVGGTSSDSYVRMRWSAKQ